MKRRHAVAATISLLALMTFSLAASGCDPSTAKLAEPVPAPSLLPKLEATLALTDKPEVVHVKYHNGADLVAKIDKQAAENSVLALDIFDALGEKMPSIPPSVPWAERQEIVIPPGRDWDYEYDLHIFDPPARPGTYYVRVRLPGWESNRLQYKIGKKD